MFMFSDHRFPGNQKGRRKFPPFPAAWCCFPSLLFSMKINGEQGILHSCVPVSGSLAHISKQIPGPTSISRILNATPLPPWLCPLFQIHPPDYPSLLRWNLLKTGFILSPNLPFRNFPPGVYLHSPALLTPVHQ